MRQRLVIWTVVLGGVVAAQAFEVSLDRRSIEEAISIGQSRIEPIRGRFHLPYHIVVNQAPVDFVEVVTPFRGVVLAAEGRARIGDRSFGLREAQQLLAVSSDTLTVQAELTFHPLNTFVTVPPYDVVLVDARKEEVQPTQIDRQPRFGPRLEGFPLPTAPTSPVLPGKSQPLMGTTLTAKFSISMLDARGIYDVAVREGRKQLGKARVEFSKLR